MQAQVRRPLLVIALLSVCVMLTFIGHTMPYPVLAPWLMERNIGLGALGWVSFAFSLGNLIGAPFAGNLVDRWGRRPMLIIGLMAIVIVNAITPFSDGLNQFIALRFILGLFNSGVMPAALAATADIAPEARRAAWIGYVTGGISIGLIIGPTVGGILYDAFGFAAAFYVSAGMAFVAVLLVLLIMPETRGHVAPTDDYSHKINWFGLWRNPPRPLLALGLLLWIDFSWVFAWVATEPATLTHLYGNHNYTATMFGVVVGVYGAATALGELGAGSLSDRYGRFVIIAVGFLVHVAWYIGVDQTPAYTSMLVASLISGLGAGLVTPALGAAYIDITTPDQRGQVAALKEMIISLGGMLGPLVAVVATDRIDPVIILRSVTVMIVLTALCAGVYALRRRRVQRR
ncbi:MAG: MFS transporter [Roseiflexaceae bacterium]